MSMQYRQLLERLFSVGFGLIVLMCLTVSGSSAKPIEVVITATPDTSRVVVEGNGPPSSKWSFRHSYAGILGLGSRIENFALFDAAGREIQSHRLAPGEFESSEPGSHFKYQANLAPLMNPRDLAKVSWLTRDRGLLVLSDLLPLLTTNDQQVAIVVRFMMPEAWAVHSQDAPAPDGRFLISDLDRAVFALGNRLRTSHITESGMMFDFVADGEWTFSDSDVLDMIRQVLKSHREVFGAMPAKKGSLILLPFPQAGGAREWSAETRGTNVTLLMGRLTSKVAALAQLSTPLTHELFHLWVPNGLALNGDYDWFYEGFTVYEAAHSAVSLGFLTFREFLDAIARAYDSSKADRLSLIESSGRRWTVGQSSVYAKSEVIALIFDLRLRSLGHGRSLNDVYRRLFKEFSSASSPRAQMTNGNEESSKALSAEAGSDDFVRTFISNPVSINLSSELAPYGLNVETIGPITRISVNDKLNKRQRDLLRDLGYNEATHARSK